MSTLDQGLWYVVQTQVNAENKAARNLLQQGFRIYLPRYLKRRSHARKVEQVPAPLFPRYLFVNIDVATQRWRSVQSTFGVTRLVTNGSYPAPVPPDVVVALKGKEDKSGFIEMDHRPPFSIGDKVRILSGAFVDKVGLFAGLGDHERVAILLELLGQKVRLQIEADGIAGA